MNKQIREHQNVVESLATQSDLLERMADVIRSAFEEGHRLFVLGNGGSAADAQHIAAELVGRFKHDRRALPATALTTDTSVLTAVSNDLGADVCFSRQVEAHVRKGDVVWALSVSGRSPNVLRGLEAAKKLEATCLGFTGRSGTELCDLCDLCLKVDHVSSDRVQEAHQLAYHLICDRIERAYL